MSKSTDTDAENNRKTSAAITLAPSRGRIYIGTSGYSYRDWVGHFYPEGTKPQQMLAYYAKQFPFAEINSTYYRPPTPAMLSAMVKKTPPQFLFAVKAYKSLTHERPKNVSDDCWQFLQALQPMMEAGKLAAVLLQFPYSFHCIPENSRYLIQLHQYLPGLPVAVEFRNRNWVNPRTWDLLRELGWAYTCVDEPQLKGLVRPEIAVTAPISYVRFHGRNAKQWWQHDQAYQRYDYLYSEDELRPWASNIRSLAAQTQAVYVAFNNHYQGQATRNAQMLRDLLDQAAEAGE